MEIQNSCWRFGKINNPVGGFGKRKDFYNSYEKNSGFKINRKSLYEKGA